MWQTLKTKLLITGGNGWVGRVFYEELSKIPSFDIFILDKNKLDQGSARFIFENTDLSAKKPTIAEDHFFQCDLTNEYNKLLKAIEGMDIVVHLAAALEILPVEEIEKCNKVGTENLFKACQEKGVKKIIFASTVMMMWDKLTQEPYKSICDGTFKAKLSTEQILRTDLRKDFDIEQLKKLCGESFQNVFTYMDSKRFGEEQAVKFTQQGGSSLIMRLGWVNTDNSPYVCKEENDKKFVAGQPSHSRDSVWLSVEDAASFSQSCIKSVLKSKENSLQIYYAVSNNAHCFFDIEKSRRELGWKPESHLETKKKEGWIMRKDLRKTEVVVSHDVQRIEKHF